MNASLAQSYFPEITMAPSAERKSKGDVILPLQESSQYMTAPSKNVAFAVNYELAMVDQFLSVEKRSRTFRSAVETPTNSTLGAADLENDTPNLLSPATATRTNGAADPSYPRQQGIYPEEGRAEDKSAEPATSFSMDADSNASCVLSPTSLSGRRVSTRHKHKREAPLARTRVRYDMQLVPSVRRNKAFLSSFDTWWVADFSAKQKRRSSRLTTTSEHCVCERWFPLSEDASVLWIPTKRSEWEDTVSEMTAVCTSAAIRRLQQEPSQLQRPFQPPLSRDYIRDRIDIDDPLCGYQIRHKDGGWMQGFILFTTFTTWTYGFHWDSCHPLCALPSMVVSSDAGADSRNGFVDLDGSLAAELEVTPRSGDPGAGGIVFPAIAEIALLGGLGCGEYLLRMALEDILAQKQYKYVALQATEQSKPFYERFGFIRVGAICQYGKPELQPNGEQRELSVMGYRHWTHANESERSLQKHGGPSYMMCLKLPDRAEMKPVGDDCALCGCPSRPKASFVERMLALRVDSKPRVEQLGASSTPGPKFTARRNSMPIEVSVSFDCSGNTSPRGGNNKQKVGKSDLDGRPSRRRSCSNVTIANSVRVTKPVPTSATLSTTATNRTGKASTQPKRSLSSFVECDALSRKRLRLEPAAKLCSGKAPAERGPLSYVEKQYLSVWLAVSPATAASTPRPPPKDRDASSNELSAKTSDALPLYFTNTDVPSSLASQKPMSASTMSRSHRNDRLGSQLHSVAKSESGRFFHSVRGRDGKFVRIYLDDPFQLQGCRSVASAESWTAHRTPAPTNRAVPWSSRMNSSVPKKGTPVDNDVDALVSPVRPSIFDTITPGMPAPIDKMSLKKQKVKAYPRNRIHFYNRVVKPKQMACASHDELFFVVEYNEEKELLCLVQLLASGTLLGKREGRPRYQCALGDTDESFLIAPSADYAVVRSAMVMKTPILAAEAWDVENTGDANFVTR